MKPVTVRELMDNYPLGTLFLKNDELLDTSGLAITTGFGVDLDAVCVDGYRPGLLWYRELSIGYPLVELKGTISETDTLTLYVLDTSDKAKLLGFVGIKYDG